MLVYSSRIMEEPSIKITFSYSHEMRSLSLLKKILLQ